MKEIQIDELRELQMQILDYVDAFCRSNNIKYTISGGTLLGAVRHGGYIPWDDDIDIQMLRSEYVRFTELWNKQKDTHPYTFISIESGNGMGYPFGKISNLKTVLYYNGVARTGVYIDVFPVDNVKDMNDFKSRHEKIQKLYAKQYRIFAWQQVKTAICQQGKLWLYLKHIRTFLFGAGRSREKLAVIINRLSQRQNAEECNYVFEMIAGSICKRPIPKDVFHEYKDISFENRTYMAVCDHDSYLTATFGDYMKLPPVEKRVLQHGYEVYWL